MNDNKNLNLAPLEDLEIQMDHLKAFVWLLYLAVKDDNKYYVPAIDGILEMVNRADDTLQRCINENMRRAKTE